MSVGSEDSEGPLPNQREAGIKTRQLEISHHGQFDLILNTDAALAQQWGTRLKEFFQNGVPSSWEVIGGGARNVMVGEIDGKRFVAKLRNNRLEEGDAQMTEEEWNKIFIMPRRQVYAHDSIINELKLAPIIKAALATDEVRGNIQDLGFSGLSFVEPILGVISRQSDSTLPHNKYLVEYGRPEPTTDKFLVYEYIAGTRPEPDQGKLLRDEVGAALHKVGIDTEHGDLRPDHFLVDSTGNVHLLDAEQFTTIIPQTKQNI